MSKKRRTYSREFKLEAIELLKKSGESAAQIERELGITAGLLSRWKRKFEADGDDAFPGNGTLKKQDAQIRELKRENERLRREREILKKAVRIFSQTPR